MRVGEAAKQTLDQKMRRLDGKRIKVDEIRGFAGKKQKNARVSDPASRLGTCGPSPLWTRTQS